MKDSEINSSAVHVWLVLMKAYHAIEGNVSASLKKSCLGDSDFRVLEVLLHKGALPVNAIGPKVFLTPGSISTAVERLHERGLVSRIDSVEDRRIRIVDLTPKGRKLIEAVFKQHSQHMEELASALPVAERVQLVKSLKKLGKRASVPAPTR